MTKRVTGRLAAFADRHATLTVAALTSGVIVLRALGVADFKVETALAIVAYDGLPGLLVGTAVLLASAFAPVATTVSLYFAARQRADPRSLSFVIWGAGAATGAVLTLMVTPLLPLLIGLLGLALIVVGEQRRGQRERPRQVRVLNLGLLLMGAGLALFLTARETWWPAERVTHPGGTVVGYVLPASAGWTPILDEHDRSIRFIRPAEIIGRVPCRLDDTPSARGGPTLFALLRQLTGSPIAEPVSCE